MYMTIKKFWVSVKRHKWAHRCSPVMLIFAQDLQPINYQSVAYQGYTACETVLHGYARPEEKGLKRRVKRTEKRDAGDNTASQRQFGRDEIFGSR